MNTFASGYSYTREVDGGVLVKLNSYAKPVIVYDHEIEYAQHRQAGFNPRHRTAHNIAIGKMAGSYQPPEHIRNYRRTGAA